MVNPTMMQKKGNTLSVNEETKKLFQVMYQEQKKEEKSDDEEAKIKVSDLVSKMAFYYEKIRNTVDYEEEHLHRKNAIERILRRQIIIEGVIPSRKHLKSEGVSGHLLSELIRAGYLPNNMIPETKIGEIGAIIEKYLKIKEYHSEQSGNGHAEKNDFTGWLIAMAASEIEEGLGRSRMDMAVIDYMYSILFENIKLPDSSPYAPDKKIQIYVGIHRNYLKFDREMLSFILFKYYNASWKNPNENDLRAIAANITNLRSRIDGQLDHPLVGQMNRIIRRYTVFFTILTDVIKDDPVGTYEALRNAPEAFLQRIKKVCEKRYGTTRGKLWRAAVRSIVYIFITKSVFAIMIEVPAAKWFGEELNSFALAMNISFPAILLFAIVLFTRIPGEDNTKKIIEGIEEIIYVERERKDPFYLRQPVKRRKLLNTIFGFIYAVTFFLSFGIVIWGLDKLQFSWVSTVIFLFFLAFVSFFSIRIRRNPRELIIIPPKENIFSLLSDFFYIPIAAAGKWMSEKFSRINVFVFILDFIIESPFKIFVEITEEWTKYVKERKDEIV